MNISLISQAIAAEMSKGQFNISVGNVGRGWSYTKKGPGRRHNHTGTEQRLRSLGIHSEVGERWRLVRYTESFWQRYDKPVGSKNVARIFKLSSKILKGVKDAGKRIFRFTN